MENRLVTENVGKTVMRFSLPYLCSYFLQTLYGMVDLYIIGLFCGVESTTAVSIGSQVMHMITVMIVGLAMGTTVVIGHATGGGDKKKASRAIGNTVILFMVVAVALAVILIFIRTPIVKVMSTPDEAVDGTLSYLLICFIGIPAITAYNIISSIFRGLGDSKSPMYFIAIACVVNIALDWLFIGPLSMGPSGAALATVSAQTFSVIIALIFIKKKDTGISVKAADLKPDKETMGEIVKIGIPIALQDGFVQIAFLVLTVIANQRGLNDAAAVGIVEKLISLMFLVPSSMLSTVSALGAQNIGAGREDRARKVLYYALAIAVSWGVLMVIIMQINADFFVGLFTTSEEVAALGGQYMRGYVFDCICAGIHFSFSGYFCAYGKSGYSFLHNCCSILLGRIPLAYLASVNFPDTLLPMGLATSAGSAISVIICIVLYRFMRRRQKRREYEY